MVHLYLAYLEKEDPGIIDPLPTHPTLEVYQLLTNFASEGPFLGGLEFLVGRSWGFLFVAHLFLGRDVLGACLFKNPNHFLLYTWKA